MDFQFYTNQISQASRKVAAGILVLGLVLTGMGFLIYVLRDLFAILFAAIFCAAGAGCGVFAIKLYFAQRKFARFNSDDSQPYRQNVQIHIEEHDEL